MDGWLLKKVPPTGSKIFEVPTTGPGGEDKYISLGENVLLVHRKFKFFITTKLVNPNFMPEIYNQLTVINFTLTVEGLTDQVLSKVIALKHPVLDHTRKKLVSDGAANKALSEQCELDILTCLQRKDLLTHPDTIIILERSKKTTEELVKKEEELELARSDIEALKTAYRQVAYRTSFLYYTIVELPNVDPMYQFSLEWFLNIYEDVIRKVMSMKDLHEYKFLNTMESEFHISLFQNVVNSLFNKDKILYSFVFVAASMQYVNYKIYKGELKLSFKFHFLSILF